MILILILDMFSFVSSDSSTLNNWKLHKTKKTRYVSLYKCELNYFILIYDDTNSAHIDINMKIILPIVTYTTTIH